MITRTWKVCGCDGHRQRVSFFASFKWDFTKGEDVRIIEVDCADKTASNDYVIVKITRNTAEECERELWAQISDGIFEDSRVGDVEELN